MHRKEFMSGAVCQDKKLVAGEDIGLSGKKVVSSAEWT